MTERYLGIGGTMDEQQCRRGLPDGAQGCDAVGVKRRNPACFVDGTLKPSARDHVQRCG